jgi:phage shock protein A
MAYVTREAREDLLGTIADAIEQIGLALADLGAAYEQLDDQSADRLEEQLFRPVQVAYGRAKRTHSGFAERHGLTGLSFDSAAPSAASRGVRGLLDDAVDAVARADGELTELQDSMMPVEVGDPELRANLAEVRELIGDVRARARTFMRTFGR